jgi:hypothetical protein
MSWVEVMDARRGHTVLELQPTVVEVWQAGQQGSTRIHLRLLQITPQGPDGQGNQTVRLDVLSGGAGLDLAVDESSWMRLWPWIEQVRQAQHRVVGGGVHGQGLPAGYAPPPGFSGPPPPMGVVDP